MAGKTWFITGASRGFGREWSAAALRRGDRVAATARNPATLEALAEEFGDRVLALALDVTDRDAVYATVAQAHEHFGALDIVVNNAGYGHFGMLEEVTEDEARDQIETNLFGALWVTQAALPFLRAQGGGRLLQVSSVGGVSAFPSLGIYHASKWAVEGFSEALAKEVGGFGIRVTLIEPGAFSTDWGGSSARHSARHDAYTPAHEAMDAYRASHRDGRGDPSATAEAILRIVDAEDPPLRAFLGSTALSMVEPDYESRLATWREWQQVAELAQGQAQPAA
jgi:NAD(P)-dependent dehydrogenase (short-subunit alcohol dehydrogenase family)